MAETRDGPPMTAAGEERLLTWRFVALNAAYFSLCCSLAAFFGLKGHLDGLGLERWQVDILLGGLGLGGLLARPFIAPHLPSRRACLVCLGASCGVITLALLSYVLAGGFASFLLVRLVNGFGFGGVFCALVALSPHTFPASRGGVAFSILSISCLGPFIILPPVLERLSSALGGYLHMVAASSAPLLLSAPLLWLSFARASKSGGWEVDKEAKEKPRPSLREHVSGLLSPCMLVLLFSTFSFYYSYAWVFYHSDSICLAAGVRNPGFLMSVAICCTIGFRLALAPLFDGRLRLALLAGALLVNGGATCALWTLRLPSGAFLGLFIVFGLAWGVAVPLLSSVVMERSREMSQGFNLNMSSQMQDLGYFLGPMLGGAFGSGSLVALAGCAALIPFLRAASPGVSGERR